MTQTKNTLNELILKINENNIFIKSPDESDITYGELISYMKDTYSKLSSIKITSTIVEDLKYEASTNNQTISYSLYDLSSSDYKIL